jgi:copper chaperone CopZ
MAHYIHHVPGRLRVRTPAVKRNPAGAAALREAIETLAGVTRAEVNPLTGSVTVHYDKTVTSSQQILARLEQHGHYDPQRALGADDYLQRAASRAGDALGRALFGMAVEKAVERSAVALVAALL